MLKIKKMKMKWFMAVVVPIVLVATLLIPGCAPQAAPPAVEAEYQWRYGTTYPEGTVFSLPIELFCDLVEYYSDGRIKIDRFYGGALGSAFELNEAVQAGDVEVAWTYPYSTVNEKFNALAAPGLGSSFSAWEHLYKSYYNGIGYRIARDGFEEVGIKLLFNFVLFPLSIATVDKPIRTPADLKGLKIRQYPSDIIAETLSRMGALPQVISTGETYVALQTRTIDGCICEPIWMRDMKWNEVAKYHNDLVLLVNTGSAGMSLEVYNALPPDLKAVIDKAALYASYSQTTQCAATMDEAIAFIEGHGVTYTRLTDAEKKAFLDLIRPEELWDQYIKPSLGDELYREWKAEVLRINAEY